MQQKIVKNISIEYLPIEKGQIEFRGLFLFGDPVARTLFQLIAMVAVLQSFVSNRMRDGEEYKVGEVVFQFCNADIKTLRMQCMETVVNLDKVECQIVVKVCEKVVSRASLGDASGIQSFKNLLVVGHGY